MTQLAGIEIEHEWAWWTRPYIWGVAIVAGLLGLDPDQDKVRRVALRGLRLYARLPSGKRTLIC